jgi:hypothetical protein
VKPEGASNDRTFVTVKVILFHVKYIIVTLRWVPVWDLALIGLNLPLATLIGIAGKGKELTCTHDRYKSKD